MRCIHLAFHFQWQNCNITEHNKQYLYNNQLRTHTWDWVMAEEWMREKLRCQHIKLPSHTLITALSQSPIINSHDSYLMHPSHNMLTKVNTTFEWHFIQSTILVLDFTKFFGRLLLIYGFPFRSAFQPHQPSQQLLRSCASSSDFKHIPVIFIFNWDPDSAEVNQQR